MKTGHTVISTITLNQSTPVVVITFAMVFIFVMQQFFKKTLVTWGFTSKDQSHKVIQDLPNFYDAIDIKQKKWLQEEHKHYMEEYDLRLVSTATKRRLDNKDHTQHWIVGRSWYNILDNDDYLMEFAYIPCVYPKAIRSQMITDHDDDETNDYMQSDYVSLCLNYALLN